MALSDKKELIYKYVRLGMEVEHAELCAECSDEEIDALHNDKVYKQMCEIVLRVEEQRLLDRFKSVMESNLAGGDTRDVRWYLSKIDAQRFGSGSVSIGARGKNDGKGLNINIDFGDNSEIGEDNVEEFNGTNDGAG
jgi:hypothetical protein